MDKNEAIKFVKNWLWDQRDQKRRTVGLPWTEEYIDDTASMIISAMAQQQDSAGNLCKCPRYILECECLENEKCIWPDSR